MFSQASKAALFTMFETLRVELGSVVNITIVTPGFIESELTQGKFLEGKMIFDPDLTDVRFSLGIFFFLFFFFVLLLLEFHTDKTSLESPIKKMLKMKLIKFN